MFDLIIIGAGPAGLAVAVEAKRNNLDCVVIDKGTIVNSIVDFPTDMIFFSTSELLEIGAIPFTSAEIRPTRREAVQYYQKVADYYNLEMKLISQFVEMKIFGKQMNSNQSNFDQFSQINIQ